MSNIQTMKISGGVYAKVASRLKDFREKNPRASIKSTTMPYGEGGMMIQAYILTDKANEFSADATGTASYTAKEMSQAKAFEKLETIAVGRALALLGWLNNGEIASTEEMEEFEEMKANKKQAEVDAGVNQLQNSKTLDDLRKVFMTLDMANPDIVAAKDKRKKELSESTKTPTE